MQNFTRKKNGIFFQLRKIVFFLKANFFFAGVVIISYFLPLKNEIVLLHHYNCNNSISQIHSILISHSLIFLEKNHQ